MSLRGAGAISLLSMRSLRCRVAREGDADGVPSLSIHPLYPPTPTPSSPLHSHTTTRPSSTRSATRGRRLPTRVRKRTPLLYYRHSNHTTTERPPVLPLLRLFILSTPPFWFSLWRAFTSNVDVRRSFARARVRCFLWDLSFRALTHHCFPVCPHYPCCPPIVCRTRLCWSRWRETRTLNSFSEPNWAFCARHTVVASGHSYIANTHPHRA